MSFPQDVWVREKWHHIRNHDAHVDDSGDEVRSRYLLLTIAIRNFLDDTLIHSLKCMYRVNCGWTSASLAMLSFFFFFTKQFKHLAEVVKGRTERWKLEKNLSWYIFVKKKSSGEEGFLITQAHLIAQFFLPLYDDWEELRKRGKRRCNYAIRDQNMHAMDAFGNIPYLCSLFFLVSWF